MAGFTNRFERLELKFVIDEIDAERIRPQIEPYCIPDQHSRTPAHDRPGRTGYQISSLYLDTPSLAFHRAKERGDPDRVKLRVRTYAGSTSGTLEVKRRRSDIIDKTRAVIDRDRVRDAVLGLDDPRGSGETRFLDDFRWLVSTSGAQPTLHVRYEREAYESWVDHYARVTFDRHIEVRRTDDWSLEPGEDGWCAFDEHWNGARHSPPVVMEIKCESAVPDWVTEVIRRNDLTRSSFSKYSIGIDLTDLVAGRARGRSRSAGALA